MKLSGLSFNALPPIDLPFRFFYTAPFFVLFSAVIILFSDDAIWLNRWHPHLLAITHGFTLGFITMIMLGALLQLLPVIGGVGIAKPRLIATSCHLMFSLGTLSLMTYFLTLHLYWYLLSSILLSVGFGTYIVAVIWVLLQKMSQGDSIIGFRFSILSLVFVVIFGIILLTRSQFNLANLPFPDEVLALIYSKQLTNYHALLGGFGWGGILIISVSFQVIPMFHVAPSFPRLVSRFFPGGLFVILLGYLFKPTIALSLLIILQGVFAVVLLSVIDQRKRKVPDITLKFWQLAAVSFLCILIVYFIPQVFLPHFIAEQKTMMLTTGFIYFYLLSIILGMLLKILPFLSYTHLQQLCLSNFNAMQYIPNMHEFLSKNQGEQVFKMHVLSGVLLLFTINSPSFSWLFAISLIMEFSWLLVLMRKTMSLYFLTRKKINNAGAL